MEMELELCISYLERESMVDSMNNEASLIFMSKTNKREGKKLHFDVIKDCFKLQYSKQNISGDLEDYIVWSRKTPIVSVKQNNIKFTLQCADLKCKKYFVMTTNQTDYCAEGVLTLKFPRCKCTLKARERTEPAQLPAENEIPRQPVQEPAENEIPKQPAPEPAENEIPAQPAQEPAENEIPGQPAQEPAENEVPRVAGSDAGVPVQPSGITTMCYKAIHVL